MIENVTQVVKLGTTLPRVWFRGHKVDVGKLTPRFFRDYGDEIMEALQPAKEMTLIEDFKKNAPALTTADKLPARDDALGWLYLMQHYLTPTRLLDWTENVLAAVYFAVSDRHGTAHDESDGELWGMRPVVLNDRAAVGEGIPIPDNNPVLDYLAREPYWTNPQALAEKIAREYEGRAKAEWCENPKPFTRPVAFEPRRDFERMRTQSSVFTIHPRTEPNDTIPAILPDDRHLVRYIIPKDAKKRLRKELRALEIRPVILFPDFEGLSRTLTPSEEVVARGPYPDPPTFRTDEELDAADSEGSGETAADGNGAE